MLLDCSSGAVPIDGRLSDSVKYEEEPSPKPRVISQVLVVRQSGGEFLVPDVDVPFEALQSEPPPLVKSIE